MPRVRRLLAESMTARASAATDSAAIAAHDRSIETPYL